ncbi:MAG TPA: metallophosphoesterase [Bacillota bacterium]|nr:metallophosphoesterase [Bacillota bacterium]
MRVIVFSDTHGMLKNALHVLKEAGRVDMILHAGDCYRDALMLADKTGLPFRAVRGNCDKFAEGEEEELVDLSGHRVLLTHGHQAGPGRWYEALLARAGECGAAVVVFGHTHAVEVVWEAGVLLLNPGSISKPRDGQRPSYGILETDGGNIRPYIKRI